MILNCFLKCIIQLCKEGIIFGLSSLSPRFFLRSVKMFMMPITKTCVGLCTGYGIKECVVGREKAAQGLSPVPPGKTGVAQEVGNACWGSSQEGCQSNMLLFITKTRGRKTALYS